MNKLSIALTSEYLELVEQQQSKDQKNHGSSSDLQSA